VDSHALGTRLACKSNELTEPRLGFLQTPSGSGGGKVRGAGLSWRRGTTGGHAHIHLTRLVSNLWRLVAPDKSYPLERGHRSDRARAGNGANAADLRPSRVSLSVGI
jgi:hypothetical protein